jgi:hypothetical protein
MVCCNVTSVRNLACHTILIDQKKWAVIARPYGRELALFYIDNAHIARCRPLSRRLDARI